MAPIPIVAIQQKSERMAQNMTAVVVDSNSGLAFESKSSQKRYRTKVLGDREWRRADPGPIGLRDLAPGSFNRYE